MSTYSRLFARQSSARLLEIVQRPADFHPEAVAAAEAELARRQLTDSELAAAEAALAERRDSEEALNLRLSDPVSSASNWVKTLVALFDFSGARIRPVHPDADLLDDLNTAEPIPDDARLRYITQVCSVFTILFVLLHLRGFSAAIGSLFTEFPDWFSTLYYLVLPLLVLGSYLFWRRERSGWFVLTLVVGVILVQEISAVLLAVFWFQRMQALHLLLGAGLQALYGLVAGFVLLLLHRPVVLETYRILPRQRWLVDSAIWVLVVWMVVSLLWLF